MPGTPISKTMAADIAMPTILIAPPRIDRRGGVPSASVRVLSSSIVASFFAHGASGTDGVQDQGEAHLGPAGEWAIVTCYPLRTPMISSTSYSMVVVRSRVPNRVQVVSGRTRYSPSHV